MKKDNFRKEVDVTTEAGHKILNSSKEKLESSEDMYKNIVNNIMDIVIVLDLKGNFLYASPQIFDISGFTQEEIVGKNGFKLMHPDDIKNAAEVLKDAIIRKKRVVIEYRTIHKDGYYIDVLVSGRIVNIEGEDRIFAMVRDISEKKRSEKKLKESEKKYKTLSNELNAIFDIIPATIFRKNRKGEYTQVNQAFADMFNLNKEDIIGKTSFDFFPSDQAEFSHENDLKVMKSGEPQFNEMTIDFKGEDRRIFVNKIPQFNLKNEVVGIIGIKTDISQQLAYEQEIIESEKKYHQLIEDSLEGVWIIDENAITTLVNPTMARILGYEVEEMIGKSLFDFTLQEDIEKTKNTLERRKKGIKEEIEKKFRRKDGKKVFTRLMSSPIFNNKGKYMGAIAFVSDITERKKTENLLRESEEKFSHLFMSSPYSIIIGDMKGKIVDCNFEIDKITGYSRNEIIGKGMLEVPMFPKEFLPLAMKDIEALLKGDVPKSSELQIFKKDGSRIWVQPSASIFKLKDKKYLQIIMQDIQSRKESDEKLRASEEKFRTLFEIAPASIVGLDLNGNIVLTNQKFRDLHGVKNPESLVGKSIRNYFIESDLPKLKEAMELSLKGKSRDTNQYTMLKEDGTEFLAEAISLGMKNENGEVVGLIGVAQDITERKKAEQKLIESEEKFRMIAEHSFMSILITVEDKIEYVNDALLHIFEYSSEDIVNWTRNNIVQMIHPDDLQFLREYRKKFRAGDPIVKPYYSYRVFTKSGKLKWVDHFQRLSIIWGALQN